MLCLQLQKLHKLDGVDGQMAKRIAKNRINIMVESRNNNSNVFVVETEINLHLFTLHNIDICNNNKHTELN